MNTVKILAEKHNLISETKFHVKSFALILRRQSQNTFADINRFSDYGQLKEQPIISVSESDLWNTDDNAENWILTAGKIQNLRLAVKQFNGIEVPANKTFSFWKHLGNPNIGKGYVVGREIREGCIVPTIAGGLCQLSNAFYDAALKADFEIIERHRHTRVIKGSLAEKDRDATVKWNYVDLRFRSSSAFRIEIEISSEKLIVKFRSAERNVSAPEVKSNILLQSSKLNDCYSCGNFECFKHPEKASIKKEKAITTFILDEKWSEFDDYIKTVSTEKDFVILPLKKNSFITTSRYEWSVKNPANVKSTAAAAIFRALQLRIASKKNTNVFSLMLKLDKKMVNAAVKHIPVESTHIVVSQNLLPYLWQQGVLGGRTFDVLMTRLPIEKLHQRLDYAHSKFPESGTLNDFRASLELTELENISLTKARHVITPHKEIADMFNNKSIHLQWQMPEVRLNGKSTGNKILFPASALGRKGAYEIRQLAKELDLSIIYTGAITESKDFWKDVKAEHATGNLLDNVRLIIYPAYVEHQPRFLLKAIAKGIPVITTTACGLMPSENVTIVSIGDFEELKRAVAEKQLAR
jgi:hypothetical protein